MNPDVCPHCGVALPRKARVCPGCGADERTGWSERADEDRLGISDPDSFDHEQFVREEFGGGGRQVAMRTWVWVVAVLLLAALLAGWIL